MNFSCVFQKTDPLKMQNQSFFSPTLNSLLKPLMQSNLDANFLRRLLHILEAVLDHLGVSGWLFANFKWFKHLMV